MLCSVALKNHLNGSQNPLAQFQRAIKREVYFRQQVRGDAAAFVRLRADQPTERRA